MKKNYLKYILLLLLVLLMFGAAAFFTYFRVLHVEVRGSTRYTEDEVKEKVLTGILAKNSVLAPIMYSHSAHDMAFVDEVAVTRLSRDTIMVSVHEKKPVGCFQYLDSYIYFDRNGVFLEGTKTREENIPFFHGIQVTRVQEGEKIPMKGDELLSTSVTLSTIFEKNDTHPDYVEYNEAGQVLIVYGDITVNLGKNQYLEDKMARVFAILPMLSGKKGILHLESVSDTSRTVTFEQDEEQYEQSQWHGGYDEDGDYTGTGEYDSQGNYVGPKPEEESTDPSAEPTVSPAPEPTEETSEEPTVSAENVSDTSEESWDSGSDSYDSSYDWNDEDYSSDGWEEDYGAYNESYDQSYDESYDANYDYSYDESYYDSGYNDYEGYGM